MNDFELTNPHEADPGLSEPSAALERSFSLNRPAWVPAPKHARRRRARRFLAYRRSGRIAAAVAICAAIGLPFAVATSPSATAAQLVTSAAAGTGASNARSAPAQGGASGRVATVSPSSFTMTTSTGQKVTVEEKSSTTYERGATPTSAKAVAKGQDLLVLGTVNSTTITARQVIVGYKSSSRATSTAKVVPFAKGGRPRQPRSDKSLLIGPRGRGLSSAVQQRTRRPSCARRLPGGHSRPSREAERRRVQRPLHRCQWASPRLREL